MSSSITEQSATAHGANEPIDKGKGKAVVPVEETEGETSEDEEMGEADEEDEDPLAEIDPSNIISNGRRTRGKQIDFAKAAAEQPPAADDDSEDDEDFVAAEDGDKTDHEMH